MRIDHNPRRRRRSGVCRVKLMLPATCYLAPRERRRPAPVDPQALTIDTADAEELGHA